MELAYEYTRRRDDFGKPVDFRDGPTVVLESILPTDSFDDSYFLKKTVSTGVCTVPRFSETEVNTERVVTKNSSIQHVEGGWPKDVDFTEQSDVKRFRKKVEKDEEYQYAMRALIPRVQRCMRQNNTVNIYEEYFDREEAGQYCSEPPSAKGLAVFRDPSPVKRTATSVNWHPEGSNNSRLAVSYAVLNFQDKRLADPNMPKSSYIWDVTNSNKPIVELVPPSPLSCLKYNPKSSDTILGGSYNGTICYFDLRKQSGKCQPAECSVVEKSHQDPVSDVFWISSKTGHQCASVSTDGQMLWWDTRKLEEPIDSLVLSTNSRGGDGVTLGGSSLEYNIEAGPMKFLVGTEQGVVLSLNMRNKKTNNGVTVFDTGSGKHQGPILSVMRNPLHTKYFLTVGDWTARVWSEDLKSPIITSRYHSSYLTSGCWSPSRAGVFYVTRSDGFLDVWDIGHDQKSVSLSHKVSDVSLSSVGVQGNYVAVGDVSGTVSLLSVCDALAQPGPAEKALVSNILERETKKEKLLEVREREMRRNRVRKEDQKNRAGQEDIKDINDNDEIKKLENEFFACL